MTARQVGIEEEFLLVRADGMAALAPLGETVAHEAQERYDGEQSKAGNVPFDHELKLEQVELGTAPHTSMAALSEELLALRRELAATGNRRGVQLLAAATSPLSVDPTTTDDERYHRMMDDFGVVARDQLTCGMHVHVGVGSPDEGVAVLDRLRPWLALLTALSANSPYLAGKDTDYASYRSLLWGQWPTAGPVEAFRDFAGYERARSELISTGAAMDDGMIYFDARLSAHYPTVEVRVADVTPWVSDAVLIAALARAFVHTAAQRWQAGEPVQPARTELLRAAAWRAARWGMTGELVDVAVGGVTPAWDLAEAAVQWCAAALEETGDLELVERGLADIRRRGTGSSWQRAAYARRERMADVISALGTELLVGSVNEPPPS